ncbi:MAG: hypothetical protein GXO57_06825 [Thermodesulfobacteria bacterium]|nr:hypothetical protein [Thermodesulfobacteriota bacterium]
MKQELKKILISTLSFFFFLVANGWATYIYDDFSSSANWSLNGRAFITNLGVGVLTDYYYQAGSMWYKQAFDLSKYSTLKADFDINVGFNGYGELGAEGITFAIIDTKNGLNALGEKGRGLGYEGIPNSIAVEFDTFQNIGPLGSPLDPSKDHIGIDKDGSVESLITVIPHNFEDNLWHHVTVFLDLTTGKITVALDGKVYIKDYKIDNFAPFNAYIGFTGATGRYLYNNQKVDNLKLTLTPIAAVPLPGSALLLGCGLIGFLGIKRFLEKN